MRSKKLDEHIAKALKTVNFTRPNKLADYLISTERLGEFEAKKVLNKMLEEDLIAYDNSNGYGEPLDYFMPTKKGMRIHDLGGWLAYIEPEKERKRALSISRKSMYAGWGSVIIGLIPIIASWRSCQSGRRRHRTANK